MLDFKLLTTDEWPTLQEIRLSALAESPQSFLSAYESEKAHDEVRWRAEVMRGEWAVGLVDGEPVSLMGAPSSSGCSTATTALCACTSASDLSAATNVSRWKRTLGVARKGCGSIWVRRARPVESQRSSCGTPSAWSSSARLPYLAPAGRDDTMSSSRCCAWWAVRVSSSCACVAGNVARSR
jgi:hypothetical protein